MSREGSRTPIRRLRAPVVALACSLLFSSLVAEPAPAQGSENVVVGTIHYSERGAGASFDGMANAMIIGIWAPVVATRAGGALELAVELLQNPAVAAAMGTDLDGITRDLLARYPAPDPPVRAGYDATISFKLHRQGDSEFVLESGSVSWSTNNSTTLVYEDGSITDNFSGRGSEALDPAEDSITLRMEKNAEGSADYTFEVDVAHEYLTDGGSVWATEPNVGTITMTRDGDDMILEGRTPFGSTAAILPPRIEGVFADATKTISYARTGKVTDLSEPVSGTETWSNLFGGSQRAGVHTALGDCNPEVTRPTDSSPEVFDDNNPGRLEMKTDISGIPRFLRKDIFWDFPDVPFDATYDPPEQTGSNVQVVYEKLPPENEAFGEFEIPVEYRSEPLSELCDPVEPAIMRVFYPLEGTNNPSGDPNWFYYWLQTDARSGVGDIVFGGAVCPGNDGYFQPGEATIHLCQSASGAETLLVNGAKVSYIDLMAVTVLHEDRHRRDWLAWGQYPACPDTDGDGVPDPADGCIVDTDGDEIPDAEEPFMPSAAYPLDPTQKHSCRDVYGHPLKDLDDEHCLAYWAEINWPIDSVDDQDWASPGSQAP